MRNYRLIVFDLDDTLFDYAATERIAVANACRAFAVNSVGDIYYEYKTANSIVRHEYPDITPLNIARFRFDRAVEFLARINRIDIVPGEFVEEYLKHSTVGVLMPGVKETLVQLGAVSKVVATNGTTYPRMNKLENSEIAEHFGAFFSSEALGVAKPNATFFRSVMSRCQVHEKEVLVVGDDYRLDIECATTLGVDSCWFNHRKAPVAEGMPSTVTVIECFPALLDVVKSVQR